MQLRLPFAVQPRARKDPSAQQTLLIGHQPLVVTYFRHRRARHYVLRVQEDGSVRVTVPRGGSQAEADRFVREKAEWIERERYQAELRRAAARQADGALVMVRGEEFRLEVLEETDGRVARFGPFRVRLPADARGPLPAAERFLREMAREELPRRLLALAATLGREVRGITVRAQRTRWGSCSPTGRISLNWRLIQLPPSVCDYVLLHELSHLVHLNHSKRFWRELERVCPWHREARAWLRTRAAAGRGGR